MESKKRVIAVDLDGTIWEDDFPNIGKVNYHVVDTIKMWKEQGHKIIIWTCRHDEKSVNEAKEKLAELGIEYDKFNENVPNQYGGDPRKAYCDIYLDDRAVNVLDIDTFNIEDRTFRDHDSDVGFLLDVLRDINRDLVADVNIDKEDMEKINEIANAYSYEEVYYE